MPDYEYMLQRLKERKGYLIGIEKESVEYKINKIEGIVKGLDYQFMITTTKLVSRGRLIEKINKEKNFIKGYKKLLMCDNTFLGYIEDRLQFNRIKVMLYEKELPYYNEKNEEIEGLDEYLDEYLREDSESGGIREGGIREGIRPYTDSSSLGTNGLSDFYKNNHNVNHNHDHLPRSCDPHSNDYPPNPTTNPPNPTNNPPKPTTNPPPFITPIHIPPKTPYNPNPPPLNTTTTYTFQKTNGSLSLNLISFEMDPIFEVSRLDIYVDLKLSTSLLLVEGTGVDITFENSSEMEIFLLGPNGPVLGVLYFPCEFFVDKKSSVLELDFRNFNYLKIDVTFNKEIKLVRQDAKILYIYNEGHEFEDLYTYTPRICGVCYKFIVLLSYAMRCRRCKFTSHKTCSDWTLFHCKKSIEIDNTQFKKSYDLSHLLNSIFSSGFRYCSHCGDRINTSKKVLQCIKCELRFHEECEINIFNSCGITLDLRKKMAEFIPPIPKNMKPKQKRSISDYQVIRVLGKGNFGKVLLVRERRKGEVSNVIKGKIKVEECGGSDEEGCVEGGNEAGGKGKAGGKGNDNDDYNEDPLFNDHKVNGQRNLVSKDRSFEKEEKKLLKNHKNMHKDTNDPLSINGPHPTNNNPTASHPTNNPPTSHPTSTSPPTLTSHPTTNPPPTPPNQITDLIALKILRKEKIVNISDVAYIEVERKVLELAAYYKHPFLMKMYFCFQDSKALYFGCEYLAGGDLFTHTVRNSFGLKDILLYASEILLALDFLHNKHYIYRDLKLDNILVGEDGHVKICDFGLCKEGIGPLAHTYTYCGTLNTIAPEIIRGEPYTKAVDWWSYGVVLYELYERRPPFTGATSSELSRNILENKPEFSKTPEDAKKLIKKLLCSEPKERYGFGPNGVELIKNHEYFKEINWKDVYEKKISPEFKPGNIHSQFEGNSREETVIASPTTTNCDYDQYFLNFK